MKTRKAIQIALAGGEGFEVLYALCDDGTIWVMEFPRYSAQKWVPVALVPPT